MIAHILESHLAIRIYQMQIEMFSFTHFDNDDFAYVRDNGASKACLLSFYHYYVTCTA